MAVAHGEKPGWDDKGGTGRFTEKRRPGEPAALRSVAPEARLLRFSQQSAERYIANGLCQTLAVGEELSPARMRETVRIEIGFAFRSEKRGIDGWKMSFATTRHQP